MLKTLGSALAALLPYAFATPAALVLAAPAAHAQDATRIIGTYGDFMVYSTDKGCGMATRARGADMLSYILPAGTKLDSFGFTDVRFTGLSQDGLALSLDGRAVTVLLGGVEAARGEMPATVVLITDPVAITGAEPGMLVLSQNGKTLYEGQLNAPPEAFAALRGCAGR